MSTQRFCARWCCAMLTSDSLIRAATAYYGNDKPDYRAAMAPSYPMAKVHKSVGFGRGCMAITIYSLLLTAQKLAKNGPKVSLDGTNNFVPFMKFFK